MTGLKHSSHCSGSRLSRRHSYSANCDGVKSLTARKLKSAERLFVCGVVVGAGGTTVPGVRPGASTISVSGGVMPTPLISCSIGVSSTLSARSIARTSKVKRPSSGSGTDHGLEQPFHISSGGCGSHGGTISGSSVSSISMKRHSKLSSLGGVVLSVPRKRKAIVSMLSWTGPSSG